MRMFSRLNRAQRNMRRDTSELFILVYLFIFQKLMINSKVNQLEDGDIFNFGVSFTSKESCFITVITLDYIDVSIYVGLATLSSFTGFKLLSLAYCVQVMYGIQVIIIQSLLINKRFE